MAKKATIEKTSKGTMITSPKYQIKYTGDKPEGNVLKAKIPNTITGTKISFPHRYASLIDTGVEIIVEPNFKLCYKLAKNLADKGMVSTTAPGNVKQGPIKVLIMNCGREIVELKHGDPLIEVWLEREYEFDWQENKESA